MVSRLEFFLSLLTHKRKKSRMLLFTTIFDPKQKPRKRLPELEEDLIHKIGQNDHVAFKIFYETINETLYAYLLSLTQNHQDAEDLLQETYLRVRASAHHYQARGKPLAWVFTIARNLAHMHHRKGKSVQNLPEEYLETGTNKTSMDAHDRIILQALLDELEEGQRSIILLHAVSGFKLVEIARHLELPISTVLSRYNRGIRKLRHHLELKGVLS